MNGNLGLLIERIQLIVYQTHFVYYCLTVRFWSWRSGWLVYRSLLLTCVLTCLCLSLPTTTAFLVGEKGCDPYRSQQISWVARGEPSNACMSHQVLKHPPFTAPRGDLCLAIFHPKKLVLLLEMVAHKDILPSVYKHYLNLASHPLRSY